MEVGAFVCSEGLKRGIRHHRSELLGLARPELLFLG